MSVGRVGLCWRCGIVVGGQRLFLMVVRRRRSEGVEGAGGLRSQGPAYTHFDIIPIEHWLVLRFDM